MVGGNLIVIINNRGLGNILMNSESPVLSATFYAFLVLCSFYVPLQAYARHIEKKLMHGHSLISTRQKSILIAYLIWYVPFLALLVVGSLAMSSWIVAITLIIAAGWIWVGHSYVRTTKTGG